MTRKFYLHLFLIALAVVIAFTTAYGKVEVNNKEDLSTISCGWPLKFVVSDQSWRDPPYPWMALCMGGDWDDPRTILWPQLAVNVGVFYLVGLVLMTVGKGTRKGKGDRYNSTKV